MTARVTLWREWARVGFRILQAGTTLLMAIVVAFALTRLPPGDPASILLDNFHGDAEWRVRILHAGGFDQALHRQFLDYLGNLLRGDFGVSWRYSGITARALLLETAPTTALMCGAAMAAAIPFGVLTGGLAAHHVKRRLDVVVLIVSALVLSTPPMVLAVCLALSIGVWSLFPENGDFAALILPSMVLALPPWAVIVRTTRACFLETLRRNYIQCARAKGLSEVALLWRHALPNVAAPVLTVIGTTTGAVFTATAALETVFNLHGLGRLAVSSAQSRDFAVAGAVILVFVAAQIAISVLTDALIYLIDPQFANSQRE